MISNLSVTDMYMSMLSSLSNDEKLDLITKLSESMRKKKRIRIEPRNCSANLMKIGVEIRHRKR